MKKSQLGRSCYKFLQRMGKVKTQQDFYNLYIAETNDSAPFTRIEHYITASTTSKVDPSASPQFQAWCNEKLNKDADYAQHFTFGDGWLTAPVEEFIRQHSKNGVIDPYAGDCALGGALAKIGVTDFKGFDIDPKMLKGVVTHNDSLLNIDPTDRLVVTNPPFMSKCTATRYGSRFYRYFEDTDLPDVYLIAVEKCLGSHDYVVAIVPETFLLNDYLKDQLALIVIVEENVFNNTSCPILVACFQPKTPGDVKIYKNDQYLLTYRELKKRDLIPSKKPTITFNNQTGNIGLRGIDGTQADRIAFCLPSDLNYTREMKVSSRLISIIEVPAANGREKDLITTCNTILEQYRADTHDLLMAPFKGNNKSGQRRRRIDYKTARAIIEKALEKLDVF